MNHRLVVILGLPRSGTTWLGKILDSHPQTLYRHEPDSGNALKAIPLVAPVVSAYSFAPVLKTFIAELPDVKTCKIAGTLPIFPKSYELSIYFFVKKFAVLISKAAERFLSDLPVFDSTDYQRIPGLMIVWKSIESLGRVGVIARTLPGSRVIVLLRHPCGYIASVLKGEARTQFQGSVASAEDFDVFQMLLEASPHKQRNPSLEEIKALRPIERLTWRWVLFNELALSDSESLGNCAFVRYEDLCADPIEMSKQIFQFAGLSWDAQVEAFVSQSISRPSERYYSVFKDPAVSANKWQSELSQDDVARINMIASRSPLHKLYFSPLQGSYDAPAVMVPPSCKKAPQTIQSRRLANGFVKPGIRTTLPPRWLEDKQTNFIRSTSNRNTKDL